MTQTTKPAANSPAAALWTPVDVGTPAEEAALLATLTRRAATTEARRRAAVKEQTVNHPWKRA